jgi:hypothetical protein
MAVGIYIHKTVVINFITLVLHLLSITVVLVAFLKPVTVIQVLHII